MVQLIEIIFPILLVITVIIFFSADSCNKNKETDKHIQDNYVMQVTRFLEEQSFVESKYYETNPKISIDDMHKTFSILYENKMPQLYNYKDILSCSFLTDGHTVITIDNTSNIVCTDLVVKITLNSVINSCLMINFLYKSIDKNSTYYHNRYNEAQELMSTIGYMRNKANV